MMSKVLRITVNEILSSNLIRFETCILIKDDTEENCAFWSDRKEMLVGRNQYEDKLHLFTPWDELKEGQVFLRGEVEAIVNDEKDEILSLSHFLGRGSLFKIRGFKEDPFSIIDLIEMGTLTEEIGAYLWILIENRRSIGIIGGTNSGKTSILNALVSFIKPQMKIVTVEEFPEITIPSENSIQMVSRCSLVFGENKSGEATLYNLIKKSLRFHPDYIIVGELRGNEAFMLFQALVKGHSGMWTMHSDSLESSVLRLTKKPMDVSPEHIPLLNIVLDVQRVHLRKKDEFETHRRMLSIFEVADYEKYIQIFNWKPLNDQHKASLENSIHLSAISKSLGISREDLLEEMNRRRNLLSWMKENRIRNYKDVANVLAEYYDRPEQFYDKN